MIRSTVCYLIREGCWLMMLRNRKEHDVNRGKWIGTGGKTEPGETQEECARREIAEETGFIAEELRFRGSLDFFYEGEENEQISVYSCERFRGEQKDCDEGELRWIPAGEILDLELWEGDRLFLKRMLEDSTSVFSYRLYYDSKGELIRYEIPEDSI